ncbi:MAG: IS3 family transposase [Bacteroidia bacterium]|nr:IS3 family transposase [Bacteroidia bacterium]
MIKKVLARNISKRDSQKEKKAYKVKWLYECFGLSKQAYYKKLKVQKQTQERAQKIKEIIQPIRQLMPRYGTEKLHLDIQPLLKMHHIKMGRDKFLRFCRENHLLVPKTKRFHITTDSKHFFHKSPNLIENLVPTHAEQVFVSDITYIALEQGYAYLALVTDLYSKKIMGYSMHHNMKVPMVKEALDMALKNRQYNHKSIIHHSDRGIQYCCPDYANYATKKGMILSTTEKYDPYQNAVAERINGILKYEFGLVKTIPDLMIANKIIAQAVELYNHNRRHRSLGMNTPDKAHELNDHLYKFYGQRKKTA